MTDNGIIRAPFDGKTVKALNRYQYGLKFHPYTCGNDAFVHPAGNRTLVATKAGWVCPIDGCGYTQDWAHETSVALAPSDAEIQLFDADFGQWQANNMLRDSS